MAEDIGFGRLPRGAKILWERVGSSRTLSLGFFFATGSRFDPPGLAGTAHLVEHLVFKGTRKHSAASLARLVDRVGGDLNAWTDREEIAFTCTVPAEFWAVAVEALTELCFHPTFPEQEFEREKEVIRNEILATLEDPEEVSYEAFLQALSPGDWSRPVAGTEESLARISLADARAWWATYGCPERLTITVSGGTDPHLVQAALGSSMEELGPPLPRPEASPSVFLPGSYRGIMKTDFQMVQVLGSFTFPAPVTAREAAVWQVASMLWGENMSSRLFQSVREQKGLCYSVTSQIFDAEGTWALQFFASCAPENTGSLVLALGEEVGRLSSDAPSLTEWSDATAALKGGIVLGAEKSENRTGRLWRQFESFGEVLGVDDTIELLATPVTEAEMARILALLTSQVPSLLVWGKVPRHYKLPHPWGS